AVHKRLKVFPVREGNKILYLGAASGTTPSHVSDIVASKGRVYCVEFAQRTMRELINNVCIHRSNMIPISADARFPESYRMMVEQVDLIYCDIAQPEQAKVLADNADLFLKDNGWVLLAIKASSIDVTKAPSAVFKGETAILTNRGFSVVDLINLEAFDKAHAMVLAQYKQ
ncbi:MAG: fibrillarin-like rRNA/tRNA 2'-O-methyltransferase, partial [Candidatus Bathyarchaeota archaeon]